MEEEIKRLLSYRRQEDLDPFEVLAFLPIEAAQRVADIGCGPGYFTIPLAKYLLEGRLYAVDGRQEMLEALRERVRKTRLGNVEVVESKGAPFPSMAEPLDGVFSAFALDQVGTPEELVRGAAGLLRPGGWCAVVEWLNREAADAPPVERLVPPDRWRELAPAAGLDFRWWRTIGGKYYMALMRKRQEA